MKNSDVKPLVRSNSRVLAIDRLIQKDFLGVDVGNIENHFQALEFEFSTLEEILECENLSFILSYAQGIFAYNEIKQQFRKIQINWLFDLIKTYKNSLENDEKEIFISGDKLKYNGISMPPTVLKCLCRALTHALQVKIPKNQGACFFFENSGIVISPQDECVYFRKP